MIVTVTLNPALDLTYAVPSLVPHGTHRVSTVTERPGGKGLNVARVLHALGEPVLATGILGGAAGTRVTDLLAGDGVAASFVPIAGETRRTVAVVDPSDATGFWEPGPTITPAEWSGFQDHFRSLLTGATVVTLCGSLPPGLPLDAYGTLVRLASTAGVPSVLDTSGPALRHGLRAAPAVVKPNADEVDDAGGLLDRAGAVVLSRGADGLLARTAEGVWSCAPATVVTGNPTGAGDACVAALARGLRDGTPWPDLLADAVALAAAAVAAPVAGAIDPIVYRRTRDRVTAVGA